MDTLTPLERSKRMALIRDRNTKPELIVRRLIFSMGFRYRLHRKDLPGKPDIVFPSRKAVILVHGCFWHRHRSKDCPLARLPKTRLDFWLPKLSGNADRDRRKLAALKKEGWRAMVVWECELSHIEQLGNKIRSFLK